MLRLSDYLVEWHFGAGFLSYDSQTIQGAIFLMLDDHDGMTFVLQRSDS